MLRFRVSAETLTGSGSQPWLLRGRREVKEEVWKVLIYGRFSDLP